MYFEADSLVDDRDTKVITAQGHVQARYGGRTLFADTVVYNTVNGVVHAVGDVTIMNADGTVEHSRDLEMDDRFRTAVAYGFSARLTGDVSLASSVMVRRSDTITQLNGAVYTPCAICKPDGKTRKRPTWSLQATRIVQDHEHHVIYYRHMVIRVFDIPVFYAPIFWHPDPTSPRRSGFLTPKIEYSKRRGFLYEQPYYWAISPSADLTVSPEVSSRLNPSLNLRYRERFYSGRLDIRAGYTYEQLFDSHTKYGSETSRSYILGKGKFELGPDWTVGFGAERVTDPTFFHRYGISGVFSRPRAVPDRYRPADLPGLCAAAGHPVLPVGLGAVVRVAALHRRGATACLLRHRPGLPGRGSPGGGAVRPVAADPRRPLPLHRQRRLAGAQQPRPGRVRSDRPPACGAGTVSRHRHSLRAPPPSSTAIAGG